MNVNTKFLVSVVMLLGLLSVASASYSDYEVDMNILPGEAYENTDVLVFGYITISDWGKIIPVSDLALKIQSGGVQSRYYSFNELLYSNDINNTNFLVDGLFYRKISGLEPGDYTAILMLDGYEVDYKRFTVNSGESNLTINLAGLTNNKGPIMSLFYDGDLSTVSVNVNTYGRSNFDSPRIDSYTIAKNELFEVPELSSFSINSYVGEDEVYAFIAYAESNDGSYSEPELIVRYNGVKSGVFSAGLTAVDTVVKKGASQTVDFSLINNGSLLTDYEVVLGGSLSAYASTPSSVQLAPGAESVNSVVFNVPRDYSLNSGDLSIALRVGSEVIANKTLKINLSSPDPIHNITVKDVVFLKSTYFNDELIMADLIIKNTGDYTESVKINYNLVGGSLYKSTITLAPGQEKNVSISLPQDVVSSELVINVNNSYVNSSFSELINVIDREYSFRFYVNNKNILSRDSFNEKAVLVIENTGNVEDSFVVSADYVNHVLTNKSVTLSPGGSAIVNATINIPDNTDSVIVNFTVTSQIGSEVKRDSVKINVFKTVESTPEAPSVVNVSEASSKDNEFVYSFYVTNNKLIAKNYELDYVGNDSVSISVWRDENFVVQPGETVIVYLYANLEGSEPKSIEYSLTEDGSMIANGTLMLASNTGLAGLTGFAVAAGSVLGIAGLVILVLFIYFYFIRQPPVSEDEFKPVEVKKADLTKPSVKNETRYW